MNVRVFSFPKWFRGGVSLRGACCLGGFFCPPHPALAPYVWGDHIFMGSLICDLLTPLLLGGFSLFLYSSVDIFHFPFDWPGQVRLGQASCHFFYPKKKEQDQLVKKNNKNLLNKTLFVKEKSFFTSATLNES